jgi:DNA-binding MarR family transcriptional regulator
MKRQKSTAKPGVIDNRYLESLLGYNCRRAALAIIDEFLLRLAAYGLRPVEFSVLSVIFHNPGVTSRQICDTIGILSPNLVRIIQSFDERGLIERSAHADDKRAIGLSLSGEGRKLMRRAEREAMDLETDVAPELTGEERGQLIRLLGKIYRTKGAGEDDAL